MDKTPTAREHPIYGCSGAVFCLISTAIAFVTAELAAVLVVMPIIPATVAIAVVRRAMGTVAIAAAIVLFRMVREFSGDTKCEQQLCKEAYFRCW